MKRRREENIKEKRWVELGSYKMTEAGTAKKGGGDQEVFDRQRSGPAQDPPPGLHPWIRRSGTLCFLWGDWYFSGDKVSLMAKIQRVQ